MYATEADRIAVRAGTETAPSGSVTAGAFAASN